MVNDASIAFTVEYERYRSSVRQGSAGKTAQFWMIYLDLMQAQCVAHVGVQENNVDMMINAWLKLLPMYFALNKINYAQYGSYYTLINMEHLYPGLRNLIDKEGLSVQAQDSYPLRTSIDQRGCRNALLKGQSFTTIHCVFITKLFEFISYMLYYVYTPISLSLAMYSMLFFPKCQSYGNYVLIWCS